MPPEFVETRERDVLLWVQPVPGNRYHELRSRRGVHAKLKWKGMYGSLAFVHTPDGTFTLKRAGFLHPRVTVRMRPDDRDIGVFDVSLGVTGTILFHDGTTYEVRRPKKLKRDWIVTDPDNKQVLTIKNVKTAKLTADTTIEANPRNAKYLLLADAIVWYAFILSVEEWAGDHEGPKFNDTPAV